jgi:hypothetical protein
VSDIRDDLSFEELEALMSEPPEGYSEAGVHSLLKTQHRAESGLDTYPQTDLDA